MGDSTRENVFESNSMISKLFIHLQNLTLAAQSWVFGTMSIFQRECFKLISTRIGMRQAAGTDILIVR